MRNASKILLLAVLLLGLPAVGWGQGQQPVVKKGNPKLVFKKSSYDFGRVPLGSDVMASYEVWNVGDVPVIVNKVIVPAGVTVYSYPVRPVFPGQAGYVQVKVDASKAGTINKVISVDATDKGVPHKLIVKGTVKPKGK